MRKQYVACDISCRRPFQNCAPADSNSRSGCRLHVFRENGASSRTTSLSANCWWSYLSSLQQCAKALTHHHHTTLSPPHHTARRILRRGGPAARSNTNKKQPTTRKSKKVEGGGGCCVLWKESELTQPRLLCCACPI